MNEKKNSWFIITAGVASIYEKQTFSSQCISEAVYGESCKILTKMDNWLFIQCEDGYEGWCHSFYGQIQSMSAPKSYRIVFPVDGTHFDAKYPFGAKVNSNMPGAVQVTDELSMNQIIPVAKYLLGVPYKWGGKSSLGFDCSGLVQSVLNVCGLNVPRDAYQQYDFFKNEIVSMKDAMEGDLHFFGKDGKISHVGFSTGGPGILHAQGVVKEESLSPNSNKFNKNLSDIFLSTHSIRCKFRP